MVEAYSEECGVVLFTLKLDLLNNVVKNVWILVPLSVLHAQLFQQYKIKIQLAYRQASKRNDTFMNEAVNSMKHQIETLKIAFINYRL